MSANGDIILYQSEDGEMKIEVHLTGETVWLTLNQLAKLFQRDKSVIAKHIRKIFESGELDRESTVANFATVQSEGSRNVERDLEYYNLDMIISVGYRVNSHRGAQFRIWATKTLREYIVKGFVIDDDRLSDRQANYFEELLERVRRIRTSEANFSESRFWRGRQECRPYSAMVTRRDAIFRVRDDRESQIRDSLNFYEKVKAVFKTSIDYQLNSDYARRFYAVVQNKFPFAITGQTAAELIVDRIDSAKDDMGLIHRKKERVTREEAEVAKNYLEELELKNSNFWSNNFCRLPSCKAWNNARCICATG